jgi:hypothetical protein
MRATALVVGHSWRTLGQRSVPVESAISALFGWTKIRSFDPPLTTVWSPYTAQPLLALLHPPVEMTA